LKDVLGAFVGRAGVDVLKFQRSTLIGVAVALGVAVCAQPAYAVSGCSGTGSSTPTTITSPSTRATTYGSAFTVQGTAPAGQQLSVSFHGAWNYDVVYIAEVTAGCDSTWHVTHPAYDDYDIRATRSGTSTPFVYVNVLPTISGTAAHVVPKGSTYTIRGTGRPGSTLTLHFHKAGTPLNDYSILRPVQVDGGGAWSRPYLASVDYRFYATSSTGYQSQTVLVQAR
jgi:hypothetical protein